MVYCMPFGSWYCAVVVEVQAPEVVQAPAEAPLAEQLPEEACIIAPLEEQLPAEAWVIVALEEQLPAEACVIVALEEQLPAEVFMAE